MTVKSIDDLLVHFGKLPDPYFKVRFLDYTPMYPMWVKNRQSFMETATRCGHRYFYPNYSISAGSCSCGNATEHHCKICKVYITSCSCGELIGMSGWSLKKRITHRKKKQAKFFEKQLKSAMNKSIYNFVDHSTKNTLTMFVP